MPSNFNIGSTSLYEEHQSGSDYGYDAVDNLMSGNVIPDLDAALSNYGSMSNEAQSSRHQFDAFDTAVVPSPLLGQAGQSSELGNDRIVSTGSNGRMKSHSKQESFGGSSSTSPADKAQSSTSLFNEENGESVRSIAEGSKEDQHEEGVLPAWSELKTKAGKERKRLPLACIACRRKKIRCSGEKPACKHCLRSRIPCVYKVTTRKAAPRTDYMAMLDKRLKRMEERVIKVIPKEDQGVVNSTGRAVVKPPLPPPPPKAGSSSKKRGAEQAFGDELEGWASSRETGLKGIEQTSTSEEQKFSKPKDSEEQNLLTEGADRLPPKYLQEHLAEVFFDYVYGQSYHLLHKPSFMRKLAQGTVPPVLTLAVCAISARFSNHPAVRTEPTFLRGEEWARVARDIALRRYDTPNITLLIVYLILGLHEFGTCQGGRSWMLAGMAQRMAYALQLHRDLEYDPKHQQDDEKNQITSTDREIRRRTMWSCFLMDRFNSSGTDRPIFVGEQYIRAQLPIKESFYTMEISGPTEDLEGAVPHPIEPGNGEASNAKNNMGVAAYIIRLVAIWGKIINYMNQGGKERDEHPMWAEESVFQTIRRSIDRWKEDLPASLHYTQETLHNHASEKIANQFLFLHIVHNQILLFMNRWALPTPAARSSWPKDMPEQFVADASRTALEAANMISWLSHEAMDHLVVAPFAGYAAFLSSTVHIHGAFSKNAQLEASSKQNLAWNVKFLTKMKKYWGMFHFVTENLRDLYRRHADAARLGERNGKDGEQAIFQYGDWFDRYPHGVSGTDYEEPSAEVNKEPGADAVLGQKRDLETVEEFFSRLGPPTKVAQANQQQQLSKKAVKKRRSKSESKSSAPAMQQLRESAQQPAFQSGIQAVQSTRGSSNSQVSPIGIENLSQPSAAFNSNFQALQNPLLGTTSEQYLQQLDRQMVLNSYANANQMNAPDQVFDPSSMNLDTLNWNSFAASNNQGDNGVWGDPSTAWFMPFNMDPPAVGEDNSMFSGNIDWSNSLAGFGDMSDIALADLTAGQGIDAETVQRPMTGGSDTMALESNDRMHSSA